VVDSGRRASRCTSSSFEIAVDRLAARAAVGQARPHVDQGRAASADLFEGCCLAAASTRAKRRVLADRAHEGLFRIRGPPAPSADEMKISRSGQCPRAALKATRPCRAVSAPAHGGWSLFTLPAGPGPRSESRPAGFARHTVMRQPLLFEPRFSAGVWSAWRRNAAGGASARGIAGVGTSCTAMAVVRDQKTALPGARSRPASNKRG